MRLRAPTLQRPRADSGVAGFVSAAQEARQQALKGRLKPPEKKPEAGKDGADGKDGMDAAKEPAPPTETVRHDHKYYHLANCECGGAPHKGCANPPQPGPIPYQDSVTDSDRDTVPSQLTMNGEPAEVRKFDPENREIHVRSRGEWVEVPEEEAAKDPNQNPPTPGPTDEEQEQERQRKIAELKEKRRNSLFGRRLTFPVIAMLAVYLLKNKKVLKALKRPAPPSRGLVPT